MKRLLCRIFGHAKPNINTPRYYLGGVLNYECRCCKRWLKQEGK